MASLNHFFLIVFFTFLALPVAAAPTLSVDMGFGRVKVAVSEADTFWTQEKMQELETDLLIDEPLAPYVTAKNSTKVEVSPDELKAALPDGSDFSALKNIILDKASFQARAAGGNIDDEEDMGSPSAGVGSYFEEDGGRVVVGSSIEVAEDEVIEELVVVAGTAEVYGTVKRLVVVGGNVHLHSTARVTEEVSLVGGQIQKDEGAQVTGKQVEVAVPLSSSTWNLVLDGIETTKWGHWISSAWGQVFFSLLKIIVLMILAFLGYWVAPAYQDAVYFYIKKSPISSFAWGIFSVFLVLPTTMFLCLSIVGIPLLPLQFSLLCLFALLGYIHVGQYLVRWVLEKASPQLKINGWLILFVGLVGLELLDLVPYVGGWITGFFGVSGFGAANKVFYEILFRKKPRAQSLGVAS